MFYRSVDLNDLEFLIIEVQSLFFLIFKGYNIAYDLVKIQQGDKVSIVGNDSLCYSLGLSAHGFIRFLDGAFVYSYDPFYSVYPIGYVHPLVVCQDEEVHAGMFYIFAFHKRSCLSRRKIVKCFWGDSIVQWMSYIF